MTDWYKINKIYVGTNRVRPSKPWPYIWDFTDWTWSSSSFDTLSGVSVNTTNWLSWRWAAWKALPEINIQDCHKVTIKTVGTVPSWWYAWWWYISKTMGTSYNITNYSQKIWQRQMDANQTGYNLKQILYAWDTPIYNGQQYLWGQERTLQTSFDWVSGAYEAILNGTTLWSGTNTTAATAVAGYFTSWPVYAWFLNEASGGNLKSVEFRFE